MGTATGPAASIADITGARSRLLDRNGNTVGVRRGVWLAGGLRRLPYARRARNQLMMGGRCLRQQAVCRGTQVKTEIIRVKEKKEDLPQRREDGEYTTASRPHKHSDESIPLVFKDSHILTDHGLCLVENVNIAAFTNKGISRDGALVLGFHGQNGATCSEDFVLGKLNFKRFLASARCKLWWMTPEWGMHTHELPPETQFMLVELQEGGPYAVFLPLLDRQGFRATLRAPKCPHFGQAEDLAVRIESGDETVKGSSWQKALYIAAGWNPFELVDKSIIAAASLSGTAKPRQKKEIPDSLNAFGWCTWDAFYSTVSAKGVAEGLNSLYQGGTPAKLLIIDDGWQITATDPWLRKSPTAALHLPKAEETEADCLVAEAEVLAKSMEHLPVGTSEVVMPTLTGAGPPDYEEKTADDDDYENDEVDADVRAAVGFFQRVLGWILGLFHATIFLLYQWLIDPAPPGSWRVQAFAALAQGPLKATLLQFYAAAGDFSRRLISIEANGKFSSPRAGPNAKFLKREGRLGDVVSYLRREFGVSHIYCWHGLPAYWSGVMPEEPGVSKYNPSILYAKPTEGLLEIEPSLAWNPSVLAGIGVVDDPEELYNDMHSYLSGAGVDGVKVDCQAGVGLIGSVLGGGPAVSELYHAALEKSIAKYFPGNHVINCMCHSTENLYRFDNTAVARASDDFYPRDPSSTTPHIAASAYNSLFLSPLVVPDWDMFQSKHPGADLHAAARAVSGGPVYVSDKPGNHNFDVLKQLVLPDGSILRAKIPARPTRDCLFQNVLRDKETLLKVWTMNSCSGVVGVFNLQGASWNRASRHFCTHTKWPPTLESRVTPRDVEALKEQVRKTPGFTGQYAVYTFRGQQLHKVSEDDCLAVQLPAMGYEVVSFCPVLEVSGIEFSPIGLTGMLNGSGAVMSRRFGRDGLGRYSQKLGSSNVIGVDGSSVHSKLLSANVEQMNGHNSGNGCGREVMMELERSTAKTHHTFSLIEKSTVFSINVRGCGEFLMYSSREPTDIWLESQSAPFCYDKETGSLRVGIPEMPLMKTNISVIF